MHIPLIASSKSGALLSSRPVMRCSRFQQHHCQGGNQAESARRRLGHPRLNRSRNLSLLTGASAVAGMTRAGFCRARPAARCPTSLRVWRSPESPASNRIDRSSDRWSCLASPFRNVAPGAIDMHFGSRAGRGQRRVEPRTGGSCQGVALRPGEKYGPKVLRYGRNGSERTSIDGSRECRSG